MSKIGRWDPRDYFVAGSMLYLSSSRRRPRRYRGERRAPEPQYGGVPMLLAIIRDQDTTDLGRWT